MYVAVDKQNLIFLDRHRDCVTLACVAHMQHPELPITTYLCDDKSFLYDLTPYEMHLLFKNTTGVMVKEYNRRMKNLLLDIVYRMDELDAVREEAIAQEEWCSDTDDSYLYVKGAMLPTKGEDLFPAHSVPRLVDQQPVLDADTAELIQRYFPTVAQETAPVQRTARSGVPSPLATPKKPRSERNSPPAAGTVTGSIWVAADALWNARGQPTDKADLKSIRKAVMEQLNTINPSTLSVQLSAWAKTK